MTILFGGIQLNDPTGLGTKLQLTQGYPGFVTVRGKDYIVPGRRGRVAMPRVADLRTLLIEGYIQAASFDDYRDLADTMALLFDPELDAQVLSISGPYLGLPPGTTKTINARVLNVVLGPLLGDGTFRHWSIELESVDPDWVEGGGSGS